MEKRAIDICDKLQRAGFKAYFAGGCVRDMLIDQDPVDYDIATSATPDEIESVFEDGKFKYAGKCFGVMIMFHEGHEFDIATFRSDSDLSDGRRPDAVFFSNPLMDAQRRDFTINGIFFDPINNEYHDFVGGRSDLGRKVLKFIGVASKRINEDQLRMMRAVRFKNRFSLSYDKNSFDAIKENAFKVNNLSHERIRDELNKMLNSKWRVEAILDLRDLGLLEVILPEVFGLIDTEQSQKYCQEGDAFDHTIKAIKQCHINSPLDIVWAALLHDIGKSKTIIDDGDRLRFPKHAQASCEMARKIMHRLKFPNTMISKILWLIEHHMSIGDLLDCPLATKRKYYLHDWFPDLLELCRIDSRGHDPEDLTLYHKIKDDFDNDHTIFLPGLEKFLSGRDVIDDLGVSEGPEIARLLDLTWEAQLEERIGSKKEALEFAKSKIN